MKKFKSLLWILGIILTLGILGIWFLVYGNRLLGSIVYNSGAGYLMDIREIETSCANKLQLFLSPNADANKMQEWGQKFGYYEKDLLLSSQGMWYVTFDTTRPNWKDAIKQARNDDLISSYVLPPKPLDGCK